ncbi:hypothetical protein BRD00_02735 [Halobacteriales archaeon QS_8_69_26]|nr:MAG: hypothetical protein BRD00_02735 [Halobacteriales archaeon QS_8_69_26]
MNRRRFLAATALGALAGVAGCAGASESSTPSDGMDVETRHWVTDVLATDYRDRAPDGGPAPPVVLADPAEARDRIDPDEGSTWFDASDEVDRFVRDTDFERSYLLVVQDGDSHQRYLELRSIERTDARLDVWASFDADVGSPVDDLVVHSLVVRVTDEEAGVPDRVELTVADTPP